MKITSKDYHDYVIKDGKFIGAFEQMYQNVDNPWPESHSEMDNNRASVQAKLFFQRKNISSVVSLGGGTGEHLSWFLSGATLRNSCNVEISSTACSIARKKFPELKVENKAILDFLEDTNLDHYNLIIMREVIWYILDDLKMIYQKLKKKFKGKYLLIELSFPKDQNYGRDFFIGMTDFLRKFEFQIVEKLSVKDMAKDEHGYLMIIAKI